MDTKKRSLAAASTTLHEDKITRPERGTGQRPLQRNLPYCKITPGSWRSPRHQAIHPSD